MDHIQLLRRLEKVMEETDFAWSLCLVGEDQSRKLADLTNALKRPASTSGDEKQIASGYSYWGTEPAISWEQACRDRYYPVMKEGIDTFGRRWRSLWSEFSGNKNFHYVSLGPGTGEKDRSILTSLHSENPTMFYVPVDMSAEMLRICLQPMSTLPFIRAFRSQMLPIQLDFSFEENVDELNELRKRLTGDEPVLFSLLGNTMANFEDDIALVERLSRQLLRPQDRLLVEVATASQLDGSTAEAAGREYAESIAFCTFVTSALHQCTDLSIDMENLQVETEVEGDRAILIKMLYRNRSGSTMTMTLPDRQVVPFPDGDTIKLYVSRKYNREALKAALHDSELGVENDLHHSQTGRGRAQFGLDLLLLSRRSSTRPSTPAQDVFRRPR
ncbi:MAG: L-histidine N(alpha)-methyltransferase [Frankia sp.]